MEGTMSEVVQMSEQQWQNWVAEQRIQDAIRNRREDERMADYGRDVESNIEYRTMFLVEVRRQNELLERIAVALEAKR
jgi:hypothetical protein